jgi:hypothetical protein
VEQVIIQGCTETYLDIEAIAYHQLTNHMNLPGWPAVATIMQMPQSGAPYTMRSNEEQIKNGLQSAQYNSERPDIHRI